ncbi:MAG TPA: decarboxylating 6-phosphogluconate dehydrogenase [Thermoanaerobaculia bacterium]|jgi:6-phosphogluconate dehydrogenase|nr:decarboxylating 6-phosphogluconate dehydrogenase [Thermoanaerobaculia bacterium]
MQIGMIGLGRMGANMTRRLLRGGHSVVVYDLNPQAVAGLVAEGAVGSASLDELVEKLEVPRAVWLMVPSGEPTEKMVAALGDKLAAGDAIVDGGNSFFKDDVRRSRELDAQGVRYLDAGTSGGVWGLERGYCLMIGGDRESYERLEPIFATLAPGRGEIEPSAGREGRKGTAEDGYLYCGGAGAGHFVKMIHNGIEYGLMQAYAEGFDILKSAALERVPADQRYEFDLADVAELWRRGSVVTSWLLDLSAIAFAEDPELAAYAGTVEDSGEGRWTVTTAIEEAVPADVLSAALNARFRSRQEHTFAEKVLSAMRKKFGGHLERTEKPAAPPQPAKG